MPQFAISDIHGCAKTFDALLNEIQLSPTDELFLLGDYIDRGPDSKGVLDRIQALKEDGYQVKCLMGNHEKMLLNAVQQGDPYLGQMWLHNGGEATLQSFGLQKADAPARIPPAYLEWISGLGLYQETNGYILVHAGLDFKSEDPLEEEYAMLWIRSFHRHIDYGWLDGRRIVHGHTPSRTEEIRAYLKQLPEKQVINIDAGCVYTTLGHLCAFNLTDQTLTFIQRQEEP